MDAWKGSNQTMQLKSPHSWPLHVKAHNTSSQIKGHGNDMEEDSTLLCSYILPCETVDGIFTNIPR